MLTAPDPIKCLELIKCQRILTCAPIAEIPSNNITMYARAREKERENGALFQENGHSPPDIQRMQIPAIKEAAKKVIFLVARPLRGGGGGEGPGN